MSSYIQTVLAANETIAYSARISKWALAPSIVGGGFLLLLALATGGVLAGVYFFVGILVLLAAYLRYISTELAVTNKRVIAKFGFISRKTVEINIAKVESLQVEQGILGRMFNFGSLVVSGAGNPQAPIPGISDPIRFRNAFIQTQEDVAPKAA